MNSRGPATDFLALGLVVFLATAGFLSPVLSAGAADSKVKLGVDVLEENIGLVRGKRIGLVTNSTGYNSELESTVDVLFNDPRVNLTALFGPEHGIRGAAEAGQSVEGYRDPGTGLPVYSLYEIGDVLTKDVLDKIDAFVFDIQDVGARFYTYIWTMSDVMEVAAENGKEFIVLDRPNPITGTAVEGPVLDKRWASFVGRYPLPIRHGMTVGEIAKYLNGEFDIGVDLKVVEMEGWKRSTWFDQTGLDTWYRPSPNMPTLDTATVYPATCFIEATNVSEGRGTTEPFELIGAPWIEGGELAASLNDVELPGVKFRPASFTPHFDEYEGELSSGVYLVVTNREKFKPVTTGVYILDRLLKLYPDKIEFSDYMDKLWGTNRVRLMLENGIDPEKIVNSWQGELEEFKEIRKRYLLY
ncbi:MAG: exo-beta-N-acetylmuramidase NamZ domain-containing protein [Candidatus Bipolaricaulia bacterium]